MFKRFSIVLIIALLVVNVFAWTQSTSARRTDFDQVDLLVDAYYEIINDYVEKPEAEKLAEAAVRAMLKELEDPHSTYYNPEQIAEFNKAVHGTFSGIGAEVEIHNNMLRIVSPLQDSPAWNAGVQAGDIVLTVDGESTKGLTISECIKRLTGKTGTKVTIKVQHLSGEEEEITITRARITVRTVKGWKRHDDSRWDFMLDNKNKIGYVQLSQFTASTANDLFDALAMLQKKGMKGLILDLRFNPGGLLTSAIKISNKFLKNGDRIVSTKGRTVPERIAKADGVDTFPDDIPMIIIVNGASASASEIVSGALSENGRAIIIGSRTFGKGSVQQVKRLESGAGAIKLTNAYYYLPSGRSLHRKFNAEHWGVDPTEGFYIPMSGKEMTEMLKTRRESTGPNGKLDEVKKITPQWMNDEMKDPQLSAALAAVLGKLKSGEWPKVGKSGADELARLGRLEVLQRQQELLQESLDRVNKEMKALHDGEPVKKVDKSTQADGKSNDSVNDDDAAKGDQEDGDKPVDPSKEDKTKESPSTED